MISLTLGDLYDRCVQFYGKHTAITYGEFSCTYSKMGDNAHRLAAAFQDKGLKKGDNVAFLMSNCPEYIFVNTHWQKLDAPESRWQYCSVLMIISI